MKYMKYLSFIIGCALSCVLLLASCGKKQEIRVSGNIQNENCIFPVLFYEEYTNGEYNTETFAVTNDAVIKLQKHYRTFSKTYPLDAANHFGGLSEMRKNYGQLLCYYHGIEDIFVFDRFSSSDGIREYLIIKGDKNVRLEYDANEYFFDFLYFQGTYYLFCFAQTLSELSDYDAVKVYAFSPELKLNQSFNINFGTYNLFPFNFVNNSVAVYGEDIILPFKQDNEHGLLIYCTETGLIHLQEYSHPIIGLIAAENDLYIIGKNQKEVSFGVLDREYTVVEHDYVALPALLQIDPGEYQFDKILYMYNSDIYLALRFGKRFCFISYNIDNKKWNNTWIVETLNDNLILMDVKYMLFSGKEYHDLFPNWSYGSSVKLE